MATYFMFGRYSLSALKSISAERTKKAIRIVEKFGGKVKSIYALLGEKDLVIIVQLPSIESAMKVSAALTKTTGISFTTSPATVVEQFDKMMKSV